MFVSHVCSLCWVVSDRSLSGCDYSGWIGVRILNLTINWPIPDKDINDMKWFIALGMFLLVPALGVAQTDTSATLKEFDAYLDKTASQLGDSPFAAVISKNGEVIYERYYDGQGVLGVPVDDSSRWQVFSITKSFTSALVLGLCQEGLLSLDDPVSKYLPDFREQGSGQFDRQAVTIRHLMSHTSGAAVDGNKVPVTLPSDFGGIEIITEPGVAFKYSGLGMLILERTLEAATGKDFDALLNESSL